MSTPPAVSDSLLHSVALFPLAVAFPLHTGCGLLNFNFCFSSATNSRLYSLPLFRSLPLPLFSLTLLKHNRWSEGLKSQERSTARNPWRIIAIVFFLTDISYNVKWEGRRFCCHSLKLKSHRCCIIMLTLSAAETVTDSQEVLDLFLLQSYSL